MKILYICDIELDEGNAPPIHIKHICENLKNMKNDIFLITQKKERLDLKIETKCIPTTNIILLRSIFYNLSLLFILPYYIIKRKIDIIYTRQGFTLISPAIVSSFFNIPYFTELNGNIEEEMIESNSPRIYRRISRSVEITCYKLAKKIIVVTPKLKEYLVKKYNLNPNKIEFIENGVNTSLFKPIDKGLCISKLKLNSNFKYLSYVGNFASWQGLETLIKSFKIVLKKYSDSKLLLVGNGGLKKNLIELSKKYNIAEKIIFTGKVEHKLIPFYICASEICLAPFTLERNKRMGSSAFKTYEYASCGRPIITTHPNFVEKNKCGLVAKANNPQDLAKKIIYLFNNPKLAKQMGENGRKAVLNGYSWKDVAKKTEKILKDVINENKNKIYNNGGSEIFK